MQSKTANDKKPRSPRRVFGAADTLGMLVAVIGECKSAGLTVTTRNDEANGSWIIEVQNAHQFRTEAGLRVDVRQPATSPADASGEGTVEDGK